MCNKICLVMDFCASKKQRRAITIYLWCLWGNILNTKASESETACEVDYLQDEVVDLIGITDAGRGVILGEVAAENRDDCARLCCDMFANFYVDVKSCNTAVYVPSGDRKENCFMLRCNYSYCGEDFLLDTDGEEESYVIFLKMFHDSDFSFSTTTKSTLQQTTSAPAYQKNIPTTGDKNSPSTEESPKDMAITAPTDNRKLPTLSSNVAASSDKSETSEDDSDFGAIILATFACLAVAAATVLIANKCYQTYEKRKLYDKLDYFSAEPLYSGSTLSN